MGKAEQLWREFHEADTGLTAAQARRIAQDFDLKNLPEDFYENPYPTYHALRTFDPVHLNPDGSYFLTRYDDVVAVYRDPVRFSSDKKKEFRPKFGASPLYEHHTTSLVFNDPPLHTRVRKLIMGALDQRAINAMEPGLASLVDELLERIEKLQTFDLIADYAAAIPVEVIGNLLAVPHDERGPLRGWSLAILGALEPAISSAALERGNQAVTAFLAYLRDLVDARRKHPGDPQRDVLTRLIQGGHNGERLSETELLQNCIFILNAGHETTSNLIGNGIYALLQAPAALAQLRREPGLINPAIEEFLRFESSNQLGNRIATGDVEVGAIAMPGDTQITLCIGAANRDPAHFVLPDRLDITRKPNKHLAFAQGAHACAGMNVARLEGRIALLRLIEKFPGLRLNGPAQRSRRARFRGFSHIPAAV